jgi:hypothetical protein
MHRFTIVVYLLALGHVVGAGTSGRSWWMLAMLSMLTAPIVFGFTYRILPAAPRARANIARTPASTKRLTHPGRIAAEQP